MKLSNINKVSELKVQREGIENAIKELEKEGFKFGYQIPISYKDKLRPNGRADAFINNKSTDIMNEHFDEIAELIETALVDKRGEIDKKLTDLGITQIEELKIKLLPEKEEHGNY